MNTKIYRVVYWMVTVISPNYLLFYGTQTNPTKSNAFVSNHFHSVKSLLFSSARSRDLDGM